LARVAHSNLSPHEFHNTPYITGDERLRPMNEQPSSGIRAGTLSLAATLLDIGHTRLQLAATELEEERLRLVQQCLFATGALLFGAVGLLLTSAWIVLASPPELRLLVLGGLIGACLLLAALGLWRWLHLATHKPPLLQTTLAELRKDMASLQPLEPL
jgi:uncharacterized membrane protein YqjE